MPKIRNSFRSPVEHCTYTLQKGGVFMGKQKDQAGKAKKTPNIPKSSMVVPSSSNSTEKTYSKALTDLADPKEGLNDSTQNSW